MKLIHTFLLLGVAFIAQPSVAAPKTGKNAPEGNSVQSDQKFDLICDSHSAKTGQSYNDEHLRIDLAASTWCRPDLNNCSQPRHLIVLEDKLWMYRGEVSAGVYGTEITNHYVNRKTGLIRFERNGSLSSEGMCRKLPYGSDIPNKF